MSNTICVIYGASTLFILRFGDDGRAQLVGDAYVYGLINEVQVLACPGKGLDEDFVLI